MYLGKVKGCTVLVIDDDQDVRETLCEVIRDQGCSAECAGNGAEALDRLAQAAAKPCVILLDLMMPIMDGYEFRRRQLMDAALRGIPVIVLTAGQLDDRQRLLCAPVVTKPFDLDRLLGTVEGLCA